LYFLGKYDEAMQIEAFRTEFSQRFKREFAKEQLRGKRQE